MTTTISHRELCSMTSAARNRTLSHPASTSIQQCVRCCTIWFNPLHTCHTVYTHNYHITHAGRVHGVQLSAQLSTPVSRRPLPVCLQRRLFFALPAEVFSSCLAIVSAVMVGRLFLWPALRYETGYQTV